MTLGEFRYFTLLLFFVIQGCGGVRSNIDYRIGGEDPQALVYRPEGKGALSGSSSQPRGRG